MALSSTKHMPKTKGNQNQGANFDSEHSRIALSPKNKQSSTGLRMNLCLIYEVSDPLLPQPLNRKNQIANTNQTPSQTQIPSENGPHPINQKTEQNHHYQNTEMKTKSKTH